MSYDMVSIPGSVTPESGVLETYIPENRKPCFRGPETVIPAIETNHITP